MSSAAEEGPPDWPDPGRILTPRRKDILCFIWKFEHARGCTPSLREIGGTVGLNSPAAVKYQLSVLERHSFLRPADGRSPRTVEPLLSKQPGAEAARGAANDIPPHDAASVPVMRIGRIAAGNPNLAEQVIDETLALPKRLVGEGTLFMLTVAGDSMINAAINDGDLIVVRQQPDAQNGDMVAALIGDEATIKTFQRVDKDIWLMPHNPAYAPIRGNDATIMGRIVAVIRRV